MPKKTSAKSSSSRTTTTVVKSTSNPPSRKGQNKRPRPNPGRGLPAWGCSVLDPFSHPPTSIPDSTTQASIKCHSESFLEFNTGDGNATVNHGALIGIMPYALAPSTPSLTGDAMIIKAGYNSTLNSFYFDTGDGTAQNLEQFPSNLNSVFPAVNNSSPSSTSDQQLWLARPTALKVKLTPREPELYRSGEIIAGLAEIDVNGGTVAFSAGGHNAINMVFGGSFGPSAPTTVNPAQLSNRLRRLNDIRMPDGSFELTWIPTGAPSYQPLITPTNTQAVARYQDAPVLLIGILGDQTAVASTKGNAFRMHVMWHWEIIPSTRIGHAVRASPSPCDFVALSKCLNAFQTMTTGHTMGFAGSQAIDDGAQTSSGSAWDFSSIGRQIMDFTSTDYGRYALGHVGRYATNRMRQHQALRLTL